MSSQLLNAVVAAGIEPLTVDRYHQMISSGEIREGSPIELIDGMLVRKDRGGRGGDAMSQDPEHSDAVTLLNEFLLPPCVAAGCHVRIQMPVILSSSGAPEPDVAIVTGSVRSLLGRHPTPAKLIALMEVAYTSLDFDRTTKTVLYAQARIPVYWIVNLIDHQVEVHEVPDAATGTYSRQAIYRAGQTIRIELPGSRIVDVPVDAILP